MANEHFPWRAIAATALLSANLATAQSGCDSVQILSLDYAPFTDTAMQVVVFNPINQPFIGYPQFVLLSAEGDTLARESMDFFGLAHDTSVHRMELLPGATLPASPFAGTLLLFYVNGDGPQVCSFPVADDLCPPACVPVHVFLYAQFGSFVTSTFPWSITDGLGDVVGSGELFIDSTNWGQDTDPICLWPGPYTLHIAQPVPAGLEFHFGLSQDDLSFDGPRDILLEGGSMDLPFQLFEHCAQGSNGIPSVHAGALTLQFDGERATITDPRGLALGEVLLFDAMGRCLRKFNAVTSSATIDLASVAAGVHLLCVPNSGMAPVRIVLP